MGVNEERVMERERRVGAGEGNKLASKQGREGDGE